MNKHKRFEIWEEIKKIPAGGVKASFIRDLKLFKGMAGICRDDDGLAISFLHTGKKYPDDVFETGVTYHYPETTRTGSHDENEINSAKQCFELNIPLFVILPGNDAKTRTVELGWIIDFDDNSKMFLVEFNENQPLIEQTNQESEEEFIPTIKRETKKATVKARGNQAKFRLSLFKKYGSKCAVCNIRNKYLLDAAHIIPYEKNGTDDWRNGLLLCKNHHVAFDRNLFRINQDYLIEKTSSSSLTELDIHEEKINTATGLFPHQKALAFIYDK